MGLRQDISTEPVSSMPLREAITALPSTTVRQAVRKMKDKGLGCIVIVDEYNRPVGKFTERVLIRELAKNAGILDHPVSEHMQKVEGCVRINEPIERVFDYMRNTGLRYVCVLDEQGKNIVGLTGQRGIMEYLAEHFPRQVKVQMMESKMHMDQREGA